MIDFIEYVVSELKSKRLSKPDALALVRQFSARPSGASAAAIHPLLQANTSDLSEQRYGSTFSGAEFFLTDHVVQGRKVLPGAAYLEMARAAIEHALPAATRSLELRSVVWAQPIVVDQPREISLALIPAENGAIDFEVYSENDAVHCQGRAIAAASAAPAPLDLDALAAAMGKGTIDGSAIYPVFARMGLQYGPAFQGIRAIRRGEGQALAQLQLPVADSGEFVLHPSLLDSALQTIAGLIDGWSELTNEPRVPFALESLRVFAPCTSELFVWVRSSGANDQADLDLCDGRGNVCAQLRGFTWRVVGAQKAAPVVTESAPATAREDETREYLRRQFSAVLKVPAQKIDPNAQLEKYGIDSILAMKLTTQLEETFGSLPKTLFFEYQTIRELAGYFAANHAARLEALTNRVEPAPLVLPAEPVKTATSRRSGRQRIASTQSSNDEPIAIVGLSGRYPEAADVEAYWRNLREGKDCITEVPAGRWEWQKYFSSDRSESGRHFSKWGGFIEGVDEFDPLFFNISPLEAERIDPQERLFLQHAWMAIEDAGYTRAGLQIAHASDLAGQVGVYVGVMYSEYQLFAAEANAIGKRLGIAGSVASIANRVSYALNLHGPSMTLDTMCSSSLTAIHLASQDLRLGRTSLAIAGGVNVSIHPNKYLVLSDGQFISSDGHCQSFGEGGDGYIPGEGVGVVVLKRLSDAERDGDHIYAIIRGSALTHGGRTNGYTVPNPQAQTSAITRALAEAKVDARQVSYVEAHGTGTKLGDPIEIAALTKSFAQHTNETGFCRIGSAKSNIGHCESAAGIAGLTKVVLQMQHRQLVPSLHSAQLNPHIDFEATPFVVNQTLTPWEAPVVDGRTLPRIAGISSFGAGGSNAHMIVEEYVAPVAQPVTNGEVAIVLSARTSEQLRAKVQDLLGFIRGGDVDLASIAFTLQTGREAMEERLGFVVDSLAQLVDRLQAFLAGEEADAYRGQVRRNQETLSLFTTDADLQQTIEKWIVGRRLAKLVDLWVKGLELDWRKLYGDAAPRRISLPAYPFARERYWIDTAALAAATAQGATTSILHPLLHSNTSDLSEQRYRSTFSGEEFFLADHRVADGRVLPGVACLEMARAAVEQALPEPAALELRDVVWAQPVIVSGPTQVSIALIANDDAIDYEIFTETDGEETIHCQGRVAVSAAAAPAALDLEQLAARMDRGAVEPAAVYAACAKVGLQYGPSFRGLETIRRGESEVLAGVRLPRGLEGTAGDYVLHPSLLDSALQAAASLVETLDRAWVPFALDSLRIVAPLTSEMVAWVRHASGSSDEVVRLDVDLCDASGNVCVQLRGLASRAIAIAPSTATLFAAPAWEARAVEGTRPAFAEEHVIVATSAITEEAVACFERIQSILQRKVSGQVLVQIAVTDELCAGLSGLVKTAALENPRLTGQVVIVPQTISDADRSRLLQSESGADPLVRYTNGTREVLRWNEVPATDAPLAFEDGRTYLITGGLGSLGLLFANAIVEATRDAKVVVTGRAAKEPTLRDRITYRQLDLTDAEAVRRLVEDVRPAGIIHSAGMIADDFLLRKTAAQFRDVLAPKVTGTINLDAATANLDLDFFVLFSSIAGAKGNPGQADYATANAFLDRFAAHRNRLIAAGQRRGRTRSINWPLWQAGGMTVDATREALLRQTTGMHAMQTATGLDAFHRALALPHDQLLVAEGELAKMRRALFARPVVETRVEQTEAATESRVEALQTYLRKEFAAVLKLPSHRIDPHAALEDYGIDSILAMKLTNQLEKTFGALSKTLFFEYQTIAALAAYLANEPWSAAALPSLSPRAERAAPPPQKSRSPKRSTSNRAPRAHRPTDIAIIGIAGRYPQAANLREFWRNLQAGRDCITEIPADRWNHSLYFDADPNTPGKSYSKWGGFIADADKFDPLFFNISPREAALIDPQERLFLEASWEAIEDAGYTRAAISGRRVGVFAGVMWGQYELFGAESILRGKSAVPTSSHASVANRVSYFFDFRGPSIALDTMCSSSLTAIHLACEELRKGEIDAAIAGGVNLTIHPYKYLTLSQGKFAASDGRCRSFGEGGDGYVPGEGVGAILLKPLANALRDGDQIHAVIKSSSVNHGGKTNGYTVPNPNAQAALIADALKKANIDPATLSYVETHGTGTSLGDPVEVTGLVKAFEGASAEPQFCPIGSVKSNIGHLEAAAGIAAVTKSVLQIRNRQLVPSLHASPLNPNIDFAATPFRVQTELAEWTRPATHPRRAGVSSFGAGGSNAHLILEEFADARDASVATSPQLFLLSARDLDALGRYAASVVQFLEEQPSIALADLAYTSQTGRTPMPVRLAIIASTIDELREKLGQWNADVEDVFRGDVRDAQNGAGALVEGRAGKAFLDDLLANGEVDRLARLWVLGVAVDWSRLDHGDARRVSFPTYPFARERYWIEQEAPSIAAVNDARRTYYVPRWTPQAIASRSEISGRVLLLDTNEELFHELTAQNHDVVLVKPGRPVEELEAEVAAIDPAAVVHRLDAATPVELLHLAKALMKRPRRESLPILALFDATSPTGAAVAGFLKTLAIEDPAFRGKAVGVEGNLTASLIATELADWSAQEVRYRDRARLVRTLAPFTPQPNGALPLRQRGVYLITGGVGRLGLVFAEYLAKNFRARLVLVGRTMPDAAAEATLRRLEAFGAEILFVQADVARREDAERAVAETKTRFGVLHGVIHAAGVTRDAFILKKSAAELDVVLGPKVQGAINLDLATTFDPLDLFVLFSSIAGVTGNAGQCDYAFANRFLDAFAEQRATTSSGRTLSIDWPLWADGGMQIAREDLARLERQTGLRPLPVDDGLAYFDDFLRSDAVQGIALYGVPSAIAAYIDSKPVAAAKPVTRNAATPANVEEYLKKLIGAELQLAPERIGPNERLESFGIDSVMINKINAQLEKDFGALPKTLLYERETVRDVAEFLLQDRRDAVAGLVASGAAPVVEVVARPAAIVEQTPEPIAVIGVHGDYPQSETLDALWENLRHGRDLIDVVPRERWNADELAAASDGAVYCRWGGFVRDYDKFDPHFFRISTEEAKLIDPQERLFLQSVWAAIEDAGYTRATLRERFGKGRSADVGVFVGVTTNSYHLLTAENFATPSAMPWSIANRVSYFFDFNGPSLPVDTACSSSLVAIHLACESLRNRECQVAIAGGVNLYLHPAKYQSLCQKRMVSADGKTHSYGAGEDGFVPGEGVGSIVLKPLSRAIADGDRIYATIAASAFDHSGRSNGYSAPNPNAQAALIARTLEKARIHPETIGYVEGHGTGTQLGDSLEVAALTQAFGKQTTRTQFCPIGSIKANLGHSESAAGIAGLAKVLLQLKHRQLAPSIHSDDVNPNIDFSGSPFYLQHGVAEWPSSPEHPRRALINSFGAGGVNACIVVEEFETAPTVARANEPQLFVLSARNEERLRDYAARVVAQLRSGDVDLAGLCWTLQAGREAMDERLATVVSSTAELLDRLSSWTGLHHGTLAPRRGSRRTKLAFDGNLEELATRWVVGEDIDWQTLHAGNEPRRIAVPTYPFARERYWVSDAQPVARPIAQSIAAQTQLHPLLGANASTLSEVRFTSTLSDSAFYATDHKVHGEGIFPGAGFLEMACIAGNIAGERRVRKVRDIVWIQPLAFQGGAETVRTALRQAGESVEFAVSSFDDENENVVHCEGRIVFGDAHAAEDRVPLQTLKAQSAKRAGVYEQFAALGLEYGPAFRTIQELYVAESFALAKLRIDGSLKNDFGQFILHPSLIDGALQTAAGLVGDASPATPYLPFALDEIELLRPLPETCWALVERAGGPAHAGISKFNLRLLSETGEVLIRFTNLYVRPLALARAGESSLVAAG